jgi:hypothetical protein
MLIQITPNSITTTDGGYIKTEVRRGKKALKEFVTRGILSIVAILLRKYTTEYRSLLCLLLVIMSIGSFFFKSRIFKTCYLYQSITGSVHKTHFILNKQVDLVYRVKYINETTFIINKQKFDIQPSAVVMRNPLRYIESANLIVTPDTNVLTAVIELAATMTYLHDKIRWINIKAAAQLNAIPLLNSVGLATLIVLLNKSVDTRLWYLDSYLREKKYDRVIEILTNETNSTDIKDYVTNNMKKINRILGTNEQFTPETLLDEITTLCEREYRYLDNILLHPLQQKQRPTRFLTETHGNVDDYLKTRHKEITAALTNYTKDPIPSDSFTKSTLADFLMRIHKNNDFDLCTHLTKICDALKSNDVQSSRTLFEETIVNLRGSLPENIEPFIACILKEFDRFETVLDNDKGFRDISSAKWYDTKTISNLRDLLIAMKNYTYVNGNSKNFMTAAS